MGGGRASDVVRKGDDRSGSRRGSEVPKKPGNAGGGKGPHFGCAFRRKRGRVIGDEPGNTDCDPDTSEKAVSEGEARA